LFDFANTFVFTAKNKKREKHEASFNDLDFSRAYADFHSHASEPAINPGAVWRKLLHQLP